MFAVTGHSLPRLTEVGDPFRLHNQQVPEFASEGVTEVVAVGGAKLFTRRFGDPALPLLAVIHGGPTWDHSYLLPAVAELADLAHVVLFDLRGCGRSSRTAPVGSLPVSALQPDLLADDVAALIGRYGAQRADVLGFSYGGGIAIRVVDQHPGVVRRLILASTTAYPDQRATADDRHQARRTRRGAQPGHGPRRRTRRYLAARPARGLAPRAGAGLGRGLRAAGQ